MSAAGQMAIDEFSATLAFDLAAELHEPQDVFAKHGMSIQEGVDLLNQPWFQNMVRQAKQDWNTITNAKERIKAKASLALEESIVTMYGMIEDKNIPAAARVAAFKELKDVSGVAPRDQEGAINNIVPIRIFLGGVDPVSIAPDVTPRVTDRAKL